MSSLKFQDDWLYKLQAAVNGMEMNKMDVEDFKKRRRQIDLEQQVLREMGETHENHFAMVENFVEKYIPIRI